jgi:hypothetical protein
MPLRKLIPLLAVCGSLAVVSATSLAATPLKDNSELRRLFDEDQADRDPTTMKDRDWEVVNIRDDVRERRVKAMIADGSLVTGPDFYYAAMVLQHAPRPDDYLLAHDLCVVAIAKGEERAKWLAAASIDRFLINIGRPQRFGTQFQSLRSFQSPRLVEVDPTVPDQLRRELNVPTLKEAQAQEQEMAKAFEASRRPNKSLERTRER